MKNFLTHILHRSRSVHKKGLYRPHRDWRLIIVIFLVGIFSLIGINYALYYGAEQGYIFTQTAEEEEFRAVLRRDALDGVIESYESRTRTNAIPRSERRVLSDPAL